MNGKFNDKFDKVNINQEGNSVKLDGFQKVVVTLKKTVAGLEVEVSKHKANILEYKDKMSQISNKVEENSEKMKKVSTDYVKKQYLQQLLQEQGTNIASQGNTDMNSNGKPARDDFSRRD